LKCAYFSACQQQQALNHPGMFNPLLAMDIIRPTVDILMYLLTAVGLSPGGSTHLHTNNT
jgi:hypothetical protein